MAVVLPLEFAAALRAARAVEIAANGGLSRTRAAIAVTSRLMAAGADAGWPINLMARELNIHATAARARVAAARRGDQHQLGVDVPFAPEIVDRSVPIERRVWLTSGEACRYAEGA